MASYSDASGAGSTPSSFSIFADAKKLLPNEFDALEPAQVQQQITKQGVDKLDSPLLPVFILKNVLSVAECKALIQATEKRGYEAAGTVTKKSAKKKTTQV